MSSAESSLQLQDMEKSGPGGFTFTWSIHNFSYCAFKEGKSLWSPIFVSELFNDAEWWLKLGEDEDPDFVSVFLECNTEDAPTDCKFALSIHKSKGQFKEGGENVYEHSIFSNGNGWPKAFSLEELQGPDGYLDNDTLTVQCRMWRVDTDDTSVPVKCHATTRLDVHKLDFVWALNEIEVSNYKLDYNKLNQSIKVPIKDIDFPGIELQVLNEVGLHVDAIHFGIKLPSHDSDIFLAYNIHLLDGNGIVVHSVQGKHFFKVSEETGMCDFPLISKSELYKNEHLYLPNGRLTLHCLLSYANDECKVMNCAITQNIRPKSALPDPVSCGHDIWKENLLKFYSEGKLSNVTVRTPSKDFPVHRDLLCAQSKVFSAKLEQDMKEHNAGVIEIADLEDDIVCKMLIFIYTNILEDIDFNTAQKLYFAADQYEITALQKKCSNILMGCLDVSNVCDILPLAYKHSDKTLKLRARDFVDFHASEIVVSDEWKKLMETNASLTSEIYHWMFCKRFLYH